MNKDDENLSIDGFQNSFTQVILILINNAIDALKLAMESKQNFQKPIIAISLDKLGYNIVLCVRDTQVILILINNAIDALKLAMESKQNFQKPIIAISLDKLGYNIVLCVRDNAGGIHLNDKSKVFEPYFTTKHKSVGTGVGLYMAKQIIERQFNGTINVSNTHWSSKDFEDKEHFGAEFSINIPLQKEHYES